MLALILIILWVIAIYKFYIIDSPLFIYSIILAIIYVWSVGIMHNYRHDSYTPRIWGLVNLLSLLAGIVFFIISLTL